MAEVVAIGDISPHLPTLRVVFKLNQGKDGLGNAICMVDRVIDACRGIENDDAMCEKIVSMLRDRSDDTRIVNFVADPTDTWERWVDDMARAGQAGMKRLTVTQPNPKLPSSMATARNTPP